MIQKNTFIYNSFYKIWRKKFQIKKWQSVNMKSIKIIIKIILKDENRQKQILVECGKKKKKKLLELQKILIFVKNCDYII